MSLNDIPVVHRQVNQNYSVVPRTDVNKICLVDADFLKYEVTYDIFKYIKTGKDPLAEFGPEYLDHFTFKRIDNLILSRINAKAFVFLFSAPTKKTFRYAMAIEKEYKGNRSYSDTYEYERRAEDMASIVSVVKSKYTTFIKPDLEADDLLGVFQSKDTFIYSQDKDSKTVAGLHWDIKSNRLIMQSEEDALKFLMYQMIRGDTGDNIPGFPGMGEVKASEFLFNVSSVRSLPNKILSLYMKTFGISKGVDMYCENWMLLKMRPNRGAWFLSKLENEINILNKLIETTNE